MKKLYLDDVRCPKTEGWDIVRTYEDFVDWITKNGLPYEVSFDHDLTQNHYLPENQSNINYKLIKDHTGYDAAQWLIDYCENKEVKLPEIRVHSSNLEGKRNIEGLFL